MNENIVWINDGGPSSVHVHAHCLRNEQCACAYDLNKIVIAGLAMHINVKVPGIRQLNS